MWSASAAIRRRWSAWSDSARTPLSLCAPTRGWTSWPRGCWRRPGQVDVVLDAVYGVPLEAALRVCAQRARVVNIGNLAGATAQVPAGLLGGKQLTLSGFAGLHTPLRDKLPALTWLWSALARGELRVEVHTFPLEELPAAWQAQAISPHAKCVVLPEGARPSPTQLDDTRP